MPSKHVIANRERSCQTLQSFADPPLKVRYRTDLAKPGFTVEKVLATDDEMSVSLILCGPTRYEVVIAFLLGVRWGRIENEKKP